MLASYNFFAFAFCTEDEDQKPTGQKGENKNMKAKDSCFVTFQASLPRENQNIYMEKAQQYTHQE